ncbi:MULTISPECIES: hypothetical protein [Ensifer]|uniref:hypothetical protein n=1 Tax=Ensifer TaxID=106591 RepID=UPI0007146D96|nr:MULTISPECIES: hypothetical protein [Ensifer]KQX44416.1 hypothetical protein ASD49_09525 [Ensifer sp. Root1298]KQX73566.1 hypothetical protein ASD41_09780 [Ensifer sp. Root1312]KRC16426.1 hypothetical protein ASE29_09580 [Ensifer sp. Root74]KRD70286.1 hypothetical protein ASE71_23975 [Ensifer sp. Root954]MBD9558278.1 hypothetical protein [Ensifer sp. ENS03]
MSKKTKSDETADVQRLKLDFPDIHADLIAGRIPSLRKALIAAGLKDERTRLDKLKNSWTKASPTERETFLKWLSSNGGPDGLAPHAHIDPPLAAPPAIASGRYLLSETIAEIRTIMNRRRMRANDIMAEMGFAGDDLSLTRALSKGASLRLSVIAALETWLRNNAAE